MVVEHIDSTYLPRLSILDINDVKLRHVTLPVSVGGGLTYSFTNQS